MLWDEQPKARDLNGTGFDLRGGSTLGFDRLVALRAGESNIGEVIAFPKTASGINLMCDAPAGAEDDKLNELGIQFKKD